MIVTVRNEKYAKRHLWGFPQPETFMYEGEQIPAYKWSVPGTICLTTGNPQWPVREIHPDNIISIDDSVIEHKAVTDTKVFQVAGSKGQSYTVTVGPSGRTCTCPGFGFRKSCRHTVSVDIP
jgi:SWIM zinc finger